MKIIVQTTLFIALFVSCSTQNSTASEKDKAVMFKDWTLNLEDMVLVEDLGKEPLNVVWTVDSETTLWDNGGIFTGDSFIVYHEDGRVFGQIYVEPVMEEPNTVVGSMIILKDFSGNEVLWTCNPKPPFFYGRNAKVIFDEEKSLLFVAVFHPIATGSGLACLDAEYGHEIWRADVEQLSVGHSQYKNEVFIRLIDDKIVMAGDEAGGYYLQVFEAVTGKRLFSGTNKTWDGN
ncbi:hypothetical protein JXA84_04130 [candidate division WOR-3 bacterium]|nr:hypothetical protein [candidate division WOR-3 bacterium]